MEIAILAKVFFNISNQVDTMNKKFYASLIITACFTLNGMDSKIEKEKLETKNLQILETEPIYRNENNVDNNNAVSSQIIDLIKTLDGKEKDFHMPDLQLLPTQGIAQLYDSFTIKESLDSCSQELLETINAMAQGKKGINPLTRALLIGPPGSGKSSLARVIAYKCKREYLFLKASSLGNEYRNSSVKIIDKIFDPLLKSKISVAIILDEINSFTKQFGNENDTDRGVEHLWTKLDECNQNPELMIIATANSTKQIPFTIKDRFSGSIFYIPLPDDNVRARFFVNYFSDYATFEQRHLQSLVERTDSFSFRELEKLFLAAKNKAIFRKKDDNKLIITEYDIEYVLMTLLREHKQKCSEENAKNFNEKLENILIDTIFRLLILPYPI